MILHWLLSCFCCCCGCCCCYYCSNNDSSNKNNNKGNHVGGRLRMLAVSEYFGHNGTLRWAAQLRLWREIYVDIYSGNFTEELREGKKHTHSKCLLPRSLSWRVRKVLLLMVHRLFASILRDCVHNMKASRYTYKNFAELTRLKQRWAHLNVHNAP